MYHSEAKKSNVKRFLKCWESKNLGTAEQFLKEDMLSDSEFYKETGQFPLQRAVSENNIEMVKLLLKYFRGSFENDESKLVLTAIKKGFFDIACCLIANGVEFDYGTLTTALESGSTEVVKVMLKKGLNLAAHTGRLWDTFGNLNFHEICQLGNLEMVKFCIDEMKVDVNLKSLTQRTPIIMAARGGKPDIIQLLIDNGAELDYKSEGGTALYDAIVFNQTEAVEVILKNGANIRNSTVNQNLPPLYTAAAIENKNIIELLLDYGADINELDYNGNTALHFSRSLDCIKILILRGINVLRRNKGNENAFEYFKSQMYFEFFTKEKYKAIRKAFKQCPYEARKIKRVFLNNKTTMYDFLLFKSSKALSRYANNIQLNKIFEKSNDFSLTFPNYGVDINKQFLKAIRRKQLVDSAAKYLQDLSGIRIPELCYFELFDLFSNGEIAEFLTTDGKCILEEDERCDALLRILEENS